MSIFSSVGFDKESVVKYVNCLDSNDENFNITFGDERCSYNSLDNVFEVWGQELVNDEKNRKRVYFTLNSGYMDEIENLEEESKYNSEFYKVFKCKLFGTSYPIFIEFPCACIPPLNADERYKITLSGAAHSVDLYKSEAAYEAVFKHADIKALVSVAEYDMKNKVPRALLQINGRVKSFEKLTNSFTQVAYYKLTVSSYQHDYTIFSEESKIPSDIAKNDIISVCAEMFGRFQFSIPEACFLTWRANDGKERFNVEIAPVLLRIRPILFEFLVISFDADAELDNIKFIQSAVEDEGTLLIEIGKTIDGTNYLYRLTEIQLHDALKIFHNLCVDRKTPDLCMWEDVSNKILKRRRVDSSED